MKKILLYLVIATVFFGCNNDLETEGLSRITYYPTFEMVNGDVVTYHVGDVYSEPGITVTEGGEAIEFTTSGTVDTSAPGFYPITYSAINQDGYPGTATRLVVVLEENLPTLDLEGGWTSTNGTQVMTITKLADGVYSASDLYAHTALDIPVRFLINADGTGTIEPDPNSPFGLPMYAKLTFDVSQGEDVHFPGDLVAASPVAADLAFGIFLDDPADPFYTIKTWVKD
ncbi:MAG TPA: immunoglobulin-like domain-containing protein [Chryseosolibacter sp.]|nr:immunoglobulin-like domain-containing protein [Chryseosolibacter sp.]